MRRRAARLICVIGVILALFLPPQASSAVVAREVRRVLIINDLGIISSPGFAEVDPGNPHWSRKISVPDRTL